MAAGGAVDVVGDVQRDLVGADGTINVRQLVRGDVTVAGGSVNLSGRVGDDVRAAGGTVLVGDEVGGDVVAAGGTVTLAARTIEVLHWTGVSGHSMIVVERCSRGAGSRAPVALGAIGSRACRTTVARHQRASVAIDRGEG